MATGRIRWYVAALVEWSGRTFSWGRMSEEHAERELDGVPITPERTYTVAAASTSVLYDRSDEGEFEVFSFKIEGEGFLDLYVQVTDALGANPRWLPLGKSCLSDFTTDTDDFPFTTVGNIADWYGDNSGLPKLATSGIANRTAGLVNKVVVHNRDTDDAVTVNRFLVN